MTNEIKIPKLRFIDKLTLKLMLVYKNQAKEGEKMQRNYQDKGLLKNRKIRDKGKKRPAPPKKKTQVKK